jgi:hypothetical protein
LVASLLIGHNGEGLGSTVLVLYHPESSAVMVMLMNRSGVDNHTEVPATIFTEYVEILEHL